MALIERDPNTNCPGLVSIHDGQPETAREQTCSLGLDEFSHHHQKELGFCQVALSEGARDTL